MTPVSIGQTEPLWYEPARKRGAEVDLVRMPAPPSRSGSAKRAISRSRCARRVAAVQQRAGQQVAGARRDDARRPQAGRRLRRVSACANVPRSGCQNSRQHPLAQIARRAPRSHSASNGSVPGDSLEQVGADQQRVVGVALDGHRRVRPREVEQAAVGVVVASRRSLPRPGWDAVRRRAAHPEVAAADRVVDAADDPGQRRQQAVAHGDRAATRGR